MGTLHIASSMIVMSLTKLHPNHSLILAAANNVVFIANNIVSKFLSTITQLQIQRLSPLLLEGSTIVKIFQYLQNLATSKNMELLISQSSDLFQIDVTYYFNPSSNELNIFIHAPMVKPSKLLQLYKFIKFPLTQTTGHNITMMPSMDQDLLAVGEEMLKRRGRRSRWRGRWSSADKSNGKWIETNKKSKMITFLRDL